MTRPENDSSGLGKAAALARRRQAGGCGGESGMALVVTILIMMLMSALLIGFFATVVADQQASGVNRDQTQAYAAAHAGLERLTAGLGAMFTGGNYSPTAAQVTALTATPPSLSGFQYLAADGTSGYTITSGALQTATIQNGPFQGLVGLITPYEINVTAKGAGGLGGGAEVHLRRQLQTVAVPVFQFGIYSENDLSFFAGPSFDFGGRVHTNQNAYLAQDGSETLILRDVFTAVGEVVRTHLANGLPISTSGHRGYVAVATTSATNPVFQCLSCGPMGGNCGTTRGPSCAANPNALQEGSVNVATVPPSTLQMVNGRPTMVLTTGNTPNETRWTSVSTGTLSNRIRNGRTGARRLDLPLVSDGAMPIDIIRRPSITAPDAQVVLDQRFFKMASLRILLSDRAADITGLQTVTATAPVNLARLARDSAYQIAQGVTLVNNIPLALAGTYNAANGYGYRVPAGTPIADGYLKIERQDRSGAWSDVTVEILNLGFTGRNLADTATWNSEGSTCASSANDDPSPNAVIRLQRMRDRPSTYVSGTNGACGHAGNAGTAGTWSSAPTDYIPLTLYDPREGARRDDPTGAGLVPLMGGVMHYVELDVNNLRLWLAAHADTQDLTGFVVYFSDRRGNKNLGGDGTAETRGGPDGVLYTADDFGTDDQETGELGFEDLINPASAQSVSNGVLDVGEDVNGNGVLDTYGGVPRPYPTAGGAYLLPNNPAWVPAHVPAWPAGLTAAALAWPPVLGYQPNSVGRPSTDSFWAAGTPVTLATPVPVNEARVNPPIFFRRALKIVNGGYAGTLKLPRNLSQGLSVVAENPAYVQGNYNAPNAAGTDFGNTPGTDHVSAAVIADAVTLLSNAFNDISTFMAPHDVNNAARAASTTWYRMAVISGKGLNFPRPTSNTANDHTDFGTDGGAHNFLRYIEYWSNGSTLNYRGSIVSFYLNRQAVGIYKCCNVVYAPPSRGYKFDTDFLTPSLLPPRTPMFRDVNTLTFRQLLRPGQ
jgi:hypothetical protein